MNVPGFKTAATIRGVFVALVLAVVARVFGRYTGVIPDVVLALLLGIVVGNVIPAAKALQPGVKWTLTYVLRAAIILLGAGLSIKAVLATGGATLILVVTLVTVAMGLGLLLARAFQLQGALGTLIGAGTAICGGTAILAIGPLVRASDEEIAYAITTIFTFNIIALLVYPPLGHALGLSQIAFGSWAGTAVNDTSVVVATGYVYGKAAGAVATIVKLTRTVLLVPLALAVGFAYARGNAARRSGPELSPLRRALEVTPWFVLGFVAMALANSAGLFSPDLVRALTFGASFLIVVVLAAVGLNVDVRKIAGLGIRPLLVGLLLATIMSVASFSLISLLHIG